VYCLLVNRAQFIREQSFAAHHQTVNLTRALLCEVIAEKILRRTNEHSPGPRGLLLLANILVSGFEPFQNAPEEVVRENSHAMQWAVQKKGGRIERKLTSLEVAIVSESKSMLANTACQKVVDAIYRGKLVYTPNSFIDIIPDHWKHKPISLYDPRRAPLLNQYRLAVPRTRNILEICHFVILLVLYILVLSKRERRFTTSYTTLELIFDIYAAGWVLDQFASILEHGWQVYSQNLWAFLDVGFSLIYVVYLILRLQAMTVADERESIFLARTALDILSVGAPILIPRLAFNLMSENMLFVSLRAMMSDFLTLTLLAIWCFAGFLLSMKWLHNGAHEPITISKWMIWIWFGLDGTGIQKSTDFHWLLGPFLFVTFAFLGNTLFLTILVSMLSTTFSQISSNATAEIQYRRAVLTFEGVKSDAIFAYMPPFNILALLIMLPLKFILGPRFFHKTNVFVVRTINAPMLLLISLIERKILWVDERSSSHHHHYHHNLSLLRPTSVPQTGILAKLSAWIAKKLAFWDFSRFSVHGDIQAVFDTEPPQSVLDEIAEAEDQMASSRRPTLDEQFPITVFGVNGRTSRLNSYDSAMGPAEEPGSEAESYIRGLSGHGDGWQKQREDSTRLQVPKPSQGPSAHRQSKPARKDSIVDYGVDSDSALNEANDRLQKLEESVQRIEEMMTKICRRASDGKADGSGEIRDFVEDN
jgi:hypothetical protein